jgi:hypothetical protein
MDKLSAHFAKLGFKAFVLSLLPGVVSLLSAAISSLSLYYYAQPVAQPVAYLSKGASPILKISLIIFVIYAIFYFIFFVVLGYFGSKRLFTETAIPEKDKKIFVRIREYLKYI